MFLFASLVILLNLFSLNSMGNQGLWGHPSGQPTAAWQPPALRPASIPSQEARSMVSSQWSLEWLPLPIATSTQGLWSPHVCLSCWVCDEVLGWEPQSVCKCLVSSSEVYDDWRSEALGQFFVTSQCFPPSNPSPLLFLPFLN